MSVKRHLATAAAALLAAGLAPPASAITFDMDIGDGVSGTLNTTMTLGAGWRLQERSPDLVGKANLDPAVCGGIAQSCQGLFKDQTHPARTLAMAPGQAYLNATATFANDLFISGTGLPVDNTGALRFSNATVAGTITLEGNSRINVNGNTTANVNGPITGPHAFDFYATGGSGNALESPASDPLTSAATSGGSCSVARGSSSGSSFCLSHSRFSGAEMAGVHASGRAPACVSRPVIACIISAG